MADESQKKYYYSRKVKDVLVPELTHQFELEWPWPPVRRILPDIKQEGAEEEDEDESESRSPTTSSPSSSAWTTKRVYRHAARITAMSSDPFVASTPTRRMCLVLTMGYSLTLPLLPLSKPRYCPAGPGAATTCFWAPAYQPQGSSSSSASPSSPASASVVLNSNSSTSAFTVAPPCAEIVVGQLGSIEAFASDRRAQRSVSHRFANVRAPSVLSRVVLRNASSSAPRAVSAAADVGTEGEEKGVSTGAAASSHKSFGAWDSPQVRKELPQSCFLYSIPFTVVWLPTHESTLVASLPCEERVVTLHAARSQHINADHSVAPARLALVQSLQLPRGMVPLDVATIPGRPFVCVGTYEHGVLVCGLQGTGIADHVMGVSTIVRAVGLSGAGVYFPISSLTALFPVSTREAAAVVVREPGRRKQPSTTLFGEVARATSSSLPAGRGAWQAEARTLAALEEGALLLSTPYEQRSVLIKFTGSAAVIDDFPSRRFMEMVLCSASISDPDIGVLVSTAGRKLLRLRVESVRPSNPYVPRRKRLRRDQLDEAPYVMPQVYRDRVHSTANYLVRIADGPPAYQTTSNQVESNSYCKHWMVCVDSEHNVVLLDRVLSQYTEHSTLHVARVVGGAPSPLPMMKSEPSEAKEAGETTVASSILSSAQKIKGAKGEASPGGAKKSKRAGSDLSAGGDDAATSPTTPGVSSLNPLYALPKTDSLESLPTGVVFVEVGPEWLRVAVAHHTNCLSIVTWAPR